MSKMSLATLEKLEANPHYKLSERQKRWLAEYRAQAPIKANTKFKKHQPELASEDGKFN